MPAKSKAPDGFILVPNFISEREEVLLLKEVLRKGAPILDKGHLKFSNTQQQEYGPQISDAMELVKGGLRTQPPPRCNALVSKVAAEARRRGLHGAEALDAAGSSFLRVNHYCAEGGGYMHKHMDSMKCFGPIVACCSLLSDAAITFYDTRGNSFGMAAVHDVTEVRVPRRSLYFMTGAARQQWQHGIRKDQCPSERVSLTFRSVAADAPTTTAKAVAANFQARRKLVKAKAAGSAAAAPAASLRASSKSSKALATSKKRPAAAKPGAASGAKRRRTVA